MKWYYVFLKSLKEQLRDYWILALTLSFAPFFVFMYYLMSETGTPEFEIVLCVPESDSAYSDNNYIPVDSLLLFLQEFAAGEESVKLVYSRIGSREEGIKILQEGKADAMVVLPENLDWSDPGRILESRQLELVGDVTDIAYIVGAVWTEELINSYILAAGGIDLPFKWKETTLGYSGSRSEFDLYVPGLMIFAIIMMLFTASASIVREPEAGTLERLKISNLSAVSFLAGISIIQVIIGIISLLLTISVALLLGYELIAGTLGIILLIGFLMSLSMISFSLIVAAMCRSIKDVAVIGTFPLLLLMFFSGAFYPVGGGRLFSIGTFQLHLNDLLSPTWAVDALNKVLVKGLEVSSTIPEIFALVILTILYFVLGVWAFSKRHMRAV